MLAGCAKYCVTGGRGAWGAPLEGCDCLGPGWSTGMRLAFHWQGSPGPPSPAASGLSLVGSNAWCDYGGVKSLLPGSF